jgi:hypothetical protein
MIEQCCGSGFASPCWIGVNFQENEKVDKLYFFTENLNMLSKIIKFGSRSYFLGLFRIRILHYKPDKLNNWQILSVRMGLLQNFGTF